MKRIAYRHCTNVYIMYIKGSKYTFSLHCILPMNLVQVFNAQEPIQITS